MWLNDTGRTLHLEVTVAVPWLVPGTCCSFRFSRWPQGLLLRVGLVMGLREVEALRRRDRTAAWLGSRAEYSCAPVGRYSCYFKYTFCRVETYVSFYCFNFSPLMWIHLLSLLTYDGLITFLHYLLRQSVEFSASCRQDCKFSMFILGLSLGFRTSVISLLCESFAESNHVPKSSQEKATHILF